MMKWNNPNQVLYNCASDIFTTSIHLENIVYVIQVFINQGWTFRTCQWRESRPHNPRPRPRPEHSRPPLPRLRPLKSQTETETQYMNYYEYEKHEKHHIFTGDIEIYRRPSARLRGFSGSSILFFAGLVVSIEYSNLEEPRGRDETETVEIRDRDETKTHTISS